MKSAFVSITAKSKLSAFVAMRRVLTGLLATLALEMTAPSMAADAALGVSAGVSAGLGTGLLNGNTDEPSTADKPAAIDDSSKTTPRRMAKHVSKHNKHGDKPEQSSSDAPK